VSRSLLVFVAPQGDGRKPKEFPEFLEERANVGE
jgi:hypothetical protein